MKSFFSQTKQSNSNDLELTVYELTSDNEITPFTDIVDLVQENNRLSGKLFTDEGIVYIADMATSSPDLSNSSDPVRQLQTWYIKASTNQRKEFRKWMIDQE